MLGDFEGEKNKASSWRRVSKGKNVVGNMVGEKAKD